jgi:TPR repeat protein
MSERDYVKKLKAKAESGNAAAQSSLGDLYDLGDGVRKNREKAVSWWPAPQKLIQAL